MKKLIFILLIFSCIFLKPNKIFAEVRYEILKAEYNESSNSLTLEGWALIYHQDHGEKIDSGYPKYFLEVTNTNDSSVKKIYESSVNGSKYNSKDSDTKIDLTCTLFQNYYSGVQECYPVLLGKAPYKSAIPPYTTYWGQDAVDKMVLESKTYHATDNWFYRNVGFRFIIPLSGLASNGSACVPNTDKIQYSMKIKVDTGRAVEISQVINVYKEVVGNNQKAGNLVLENLPDSVRVKVFQGRVRKKAYTYTPYDNILTYNGKPVNFMSDQSVGTIYETSTDAFDLTPLSKYAEKNGYDALKPYRVSFFGLKIDKTYTMINNMYFVKPNSSSNDFGYAPATWIRPDEGNSTFTVISVKSEEECPAPNPDNRVLSCHVDNPIQKFASNPDTPASLLSNSACQITGIEDTVITLPNYPGTFKAGTGFQYPTSFKSHVNAIRKYTGRYNTDAEWKKAIDDATQVVEADKIAVTNAENAIPPLETAVDAAQDRVDAAQDRYDDAADAVADAEAALDSIVLSDPPTAGELAALSAARSALSAANSRLASARSALSSARTALNRAKTDLQNARDRLTAANNKLFTDQAYLANLKREYQIWLIDKPLCDRWSTASFYKPSPNVIADIDGSDYGNTSIVMEQTLNNPCSTTTSSKIVNPVNGITETTYDTTCNLKYEFPNVYITKYTGDLNQYASGIYYNGGRNFYTDLRGERDITYKLNLSITDISPIFPSWQITYNCDYSVYNEFPARGESLYMFRPISLSNPFPGRNPGANWAGYKNYDFTKKNGKPIYDTSNIIYEVNLTPESIKSIKQYNQTHSYLDNTLVNGKNNFIYQTFKYLFQRGTGQY